MQYFTYANFKNKVITGHDGNVPANLAMRHPLNAFRYFKEEVAGLKGKNAKDILVLNLIADEIYSRSDNTDSGFQTLIWKVRKFMLSGEKYTHSQTCDIRELLQEATLNLNRKMELPAKKLFKMDANVFPAVLKKMMTIVGQTSEGGLQVIASAKGGILSIDVVFQKALQWEDLQAPVKDSDVKGRVISSSRLGNIAILEKAAEIFGGSLSLGWKDEITNRTDPTTGYGTRLFSLKLTVPATEC